MKKRFIYAVAVAAGIVAGYVVQNYYGGRYYTLDNGMVSDGLTGRVLVASRSSGEYYTLIEFERD